jgi:hypothetical protein
MVDDVDSLHVEIDNLNEFLVRFCFIKSIDINRWFYYMGQFIPMWLDGSSWAVDWSQRQGIAVVHASDSGEAVSCRLFTLPPPWKPA